MNWCLFKNAHVQNATYLSNNATTVSAKGCCIHLGMVFFYAKSFYKCCLQIYVSFILYI